MFSSTDNMYLYDLPVIDEESKVLRVIHAFQPSRREWPIALKTKWFASMRTRFNSMPHLHNPRSNLYHLVISDGEIGEGTDDALNHFSVPFDGDVHFATESPMLRMFQQCHPAIHVVFVDAIDEILYNPFVG